MANCEVLVRLAEMPTVQGRITVDTRLRWNTSCGDVRLASSDVSKVPRQSKLLSASIG